MASKESNIEDSRELMVPKSCGEPSPHPEFEESHIDIPEDAYGSAILAIVCDLGVIIQGSWKDDAVQVKLVQVSFAGLLWAMNMTMQQSLLYFIYVYVVSPAVHGVQSQYQTFRQVVFDHGGNFLQEEWDNYENKADLCGIGMSDPVFYFVMVLLWVLLIIREFRSTERLTRDLMGMPTCSSIAEMDKEEDESVKVVALTRWSKALLLLVVCIPKFLICCTLMLLGCQWLTATNNFTDLVMNSIAMEFVMGIDESLYETLLPIAHKKQVQDVDLVVIKKHSLETAKMWQAFQRSFLYLLAAVAFVLSFNQYIQNVLPPNLGDLKSLCKPILAGTNHPLCDVSFFGGSGALGSCFPYGGLSTGHATHH